MKKRLPLVIPILALAASGAWAQTIDLAARDAYVREGFSLEWTFHAPLTGETDWIRVPGAAGTRPLAVGKLFPGAAPESGSSGGTGRWCVVIPFSVDRALLDAPGGVGLYLGRAGQNWQVYLNGYLMRDETWFTPDGGLGVHRSARGSLVELDASRLSLGGNVLAFMLAGDPEAADTGLGASGPILIGPYGELARRNDEVARLMLIGIFFFFALYHGILFALRRRERAYLYYGIGTMLLAAYLFSRTFIACDLILDTRIIEATGTVSLFLLVPSFLFFFDATAGRRVSPFSWVYAALSAAAAAIQALSPRGPLLTGWKISVLVALGYVAFFDLALPLVAAARRAKAGRAELRENGPEGAATPEANRAERLATGMGAGKTALGLAVMAATALIDASGDSGSTPLADLALLVLVFSTAAVLAGQFFRVYREAQAVRDDLERRVAARSEKLGAELLAQEGLSVRLTEASGKLQAAAAVAEKDLMVATQVQQGFFPRTPPKTAEWEVAFAFLPASGLSGDFYDFYQSPGRLEGIVVGDVSGHGIASGLITVLARSIFHRNFYERRHRSLGAILEAINAELIPELSDVENFITAAALRLGTDGGVEYATAAHTEIFYRGAGKLRASVIRPRAGTDYKGPPLGREGIEAPYTSVKFTVRPGDAILIHTDGLDEARNVDGEAFGEEGVLSAFSSAPAGEASLMLDYIMQEWRFHVSGTKVADDVTAVLLKKL